MEKELKKVSIIIPIYNTGKYLKSCLDSLVNQTYSNFEVILIDDGSTDISEQIYQEYAQNYPFFIVRKQSNRGICAARNEGIRLASGDYITFVDSDDWVSQDYISSLMRIVRPGSMAAVGVRIVADENEKIDTNITDVVVFTKEEAIASTLVFKGMKGYAGGKIYDAGVIRKNSIYFNETIKVCEDIEFNIRFLLNINDSVYWDKKETYFYRLNVNSTINKRYQNCSLSEYEATYEMRAIEMLCSYVEYDKKLSDIAKMRKVKSSVTALRIMEVNNCIDNDTYKKLLLFARKNAFIYLIKPYGAISSKVSVISSAISPKFELFLWRLSDGRNMK